MTTIEEIQKQKDTLLNAAKGNIKDSTNVYQQYLDEAVNRENQGALYSYNTRETQTPTDKIQTRSAYLNRRAQNDEARAQAELQNAMYDNTYANYLEAAGLGAQSDIDNLKYQKAIYDDTMDYQKQRDKVSDEQWQKNYDYQMEQYYQALANASRGYSSSGYSSGYGSSGNDWVFIDTDTTKSRNIKDALGGVASGALNNTYSNSSIPYYSRTDRYVIDDYGVYDKALGKYVEKRK